VINPKSEARNPKQKIPIANRLIAFRISEFLEPGMLPLANRTIALAEGRQLEELAQMLEKEGALTLRCPLLSILDAPDPGPVLAWIGRLTAGEFHYVILFTGEGVRRLLSLAERHVLRDALIAALARTCTITRGPKPVRALKEVGLAPTLVAPIPTTDGVIAALRDLELEGKTVGVQLYSDSNPPLASFLADAGATAFTVQPYVYAPATDADHVAELIAKMARGEVDAIVFTSSPQIDRLFDVAQERGLLETLHAGFARTPVASVGPVVNDNLRARGVAVSVSPQQGFVMKNLVQQIARSLGSA
jgi:uroporphyrinogen-III synthase